MGKLILHNYSKTLTLLKSTRPFTSSACEYFLKGLKVSYESLMVIYALSLKKICQFLEGSPLSFLKCWLWRVQFLIKQF